MHDIMVSHTDTVAFVKKLAILVFRKILSFRILTIFWIEPKTSGMKQMPLLEVSMLLHQLLKLVRIIVMMIGQGRLTSNV